MTLVPGTIVNALARRPFVTAEWRDLLMLNYVVAPAQVAPFVPAGTELDLWQGEAIMSLVGFRFIDTRVLGVAIPWHRDFEEVNLRIYVRRETAAGPRRAVVFIRELVPRRAIAWIARISYNEPYRSVPMRHAISRQGSSRSLEFSWRTSGGWSGLHAQTEGSSSALVRGSEAEFITEHYWGYTRQRDGGTVEYEVAHPPWRVWEANNATVSGDLATTYGPELSLALSGPPRSAFVAEGSSITVFRPRRLSGSGSVP